MMIKKGTDRNTGRSHMVASELTGTPNKTIGLNHAKPFYQVMVIHDSEADWGCPHFRTPPYEWGHGLHKCKPKKPV